MITKLTRVDRGLGDYPYLLRQIAGKLYHQHNLWSLSVELYDLAADLEALALAYGVRRAAASREEPHGKK